MPAFSYPVGAKAPPSLKGAQPPATPRASRGFLVAILQFANSAIFCHICKTLLYRGLITQRDMENKEKSKELSEKELDKVTGGGQFIVDDTPDLSGLDFDDFGHTPKSGDRRFKEVELGYGATVVGAAYGDEFDAVVDMEALMKGKREVDMFPYRKK